MKATIKTTVQECDVSQRNKMETTLSASLLEPLSMPTRVWDDLLMDFIEGLCQSDGKITIWVIIDMVSKFAHFIPVKHPYTISQLAKAFFDETVRLYGIPNTMASDDDNIFTSEFCRKLFPKLQLNSAYPPHG